MCTAELDRIDFSLNSAADGGALFVDLGGDLLLSRTTMHNNAASRNGGAVNAGTVAKVSASQIVANHNFASSAGGAFYLSGVDVGMLRAVDATGNVAGGSGGAVAVVDSIRKAVEINNSTIRRNEAVNNGGGLFLKDSKVHLIGVQLVENSAEHGGALATSGTNSDVSLQNKKCVDVDILLDWTSAGNGCPAAYLGYTCEAFVPFASSTCLELEADTAGLPFELGADGCSGCDCNDGCVCNISLYEGRTTS
jgi:hypothetical protein